MIHSSVTYKLDCCSVGGVRPLQALGNPSSFFICAFTKGHWVLLLLVQSSVAAPTDRKSAVDVRGLTCGELGHEQDKAEPFCFPENWFWISQVWSWSVQTGHLCLTNGSTACEMPFFPPTLCWVTLADGGVRIGINMVAAEKGLQTNSVSKHLLLELFRAPRCLSMTTATLRLTLLS